MCVWGGGGTIQLETHDKPPQRGTHTQQGRGKKQAGRDVNWNALLINIRFSARARCVEKPGSFLHAQVVQERA